MSVTPLRDRLRIVHVATAYLPATRYGGPIHSIHGLCKALVALGHQVEVVTTNVDGPGVSDVPLATPVAIDGVRVTYFACPALRRICWAPELGKAVRALLDTADVLHLHSVFLWPTSAAAKIARERDVPYLVSPRGMLVPELIRRKSAIPKLAWLHLVERHTLQGAARIHTTVQAEYDDALRVFPRLPPATVLPNGVDIPSGVNMSQRLRERVGSRPYAVFLGRINWKKGLERALHALVSSDIRLLIAGYDEGAHERHLERLSRRLGVDARVEFLGPVEGDDKWALLAGARFMLLPSLNENFGNVVVEALAVSCPALVTAGVGAATIVSDSGGGIVTSGDQDQLRTAMLRLWHDPALCQRMGSAGARYVREHLSWLPIAREMERCYRQVIAEKRGRKHG